jgi:hypothetical protein
MPAGRVAGEMLSPLLTVIENTLVATLPALSRTWTVTVALAAEFDNGPDKRPPGLRVSPAGRVPLTTDHEYPVPEPPEAVSVVGGYCAPAVPTGNADAAIIKSLTRTDKTAESVLKYWLNPIPGLTLAVIVAVPAAAPVTVASPLWLGP